MLSKKRDLILPEIGSEMQVNCASAFIFVLLHGLYSVAGADELIAAVLHIVFCFPVMSEQLSSGSVRLYIITFRYYRIAVLERYQLKCLSVWLSHSPRRAVSEAAKQQHR